MLRAKLAACVLATSLIVVPAMARQGIITKAIAEAEARLVKAANERDVDGLLSGYVNDAVIVSPGERIVGMDAFRQHLAGLRDAAAISVERTPEVIDAPTPAGLAYVRGRYANSFTPANASEAVTNKGSYVAIYRRDRDGRWRIVLDMTAPDPTR